MWQWMLSFKTVQATQHYQTIQICHLMHNHWCGRSLRKAVTMVQQVQQVLQVVRVFKVLRVLLVLRVLQVTLGQQVLKAHKAMTVL